MAATPQDLYEFTVTWMHTYYEMAVDAKSNLEDNITSALGQLTQPPTNPPTSDFSNLTNTYLSDLYGWDDFDNLNPEEQQEVLAAARQFAEDTGVNVSDLFPPEIPEEEAPSSEYTGLQLLVEFYDLIVYNNASWAYFVQNMLKRAATGIGHEGNLVDIKANSENRLLPLKQTDLVVQGTIGPQSKVRLSSANYNYTELVETYGDTNLTGEWAYLAPEFGDLENQDMAVFLGPLYNDQKEGDTVEDYEIYSVGLSNYYLVNDTFSGFQYATHDSDSTSTMAAYASPTLFTFYWEDFEGYYLYPNEGFWGHPTDPALAVMNATIPATYNKAAQNMTPTGTMRDPFGGDANVVQVASVSSAALGMMASTNPVMFAQEFSLYRLLFINLFPPLEAILYLTAYDVALQNLYKHTLLDNCAVCSQWPEPCGPSDGYFADGGYSDNPSVVSNIGQYQNSAAADLTKTLKLVLTNTNEKFTPGTYEFSQITQYFNTSWNQDIAPGGYVWLPGFVNPYRSPQIFEEMLTDEDLLAVIEPIEGYNHTTAMLEGTTVENPAFGVKRGQKVKILLININEPITTFVAGVVIIENTIEPLANMTYNLAANAELVERVRGFFFGDDADMSIPEGGEEQVESGAGGGGEDGATDGTEEETDVAIDRGGPLQSTSGANMLGELVALVTATLLAWA